MEILEIKKEGMLIDFTINKRFWKNPVEIDLSKEAEDEYIRTEKEERENNPTFK